jgi:hypothetical protein
VARLAREAAGLVPLAAILLATGKPSLAGMHRVAAWGS